MPGLLDIAPPEIATERFDIRGGFLEVRGLRNREWAALLRRFPLLRKQQTISDGDDIDFETLDRMDETLPAVIAAATGCVGDEAVEEAIRERLTDAERMQIFSAVMRLTNPPAPLAGSPVAAGQGNGKAATTSPMPSSS